MSFTAFGSLHISRLDSAGDEARLISGYRVGQLHGGGLAGGQKVTALFF